MKQNITAGHMRMRTTKKYYLWMKRPNRSFYFANQFDCRESGGKESCHADNGKS